MLYSDFRNKRFSFEKIPKRIVSLVPSITSTLLYFNLGNNLVGITDYCIINKDFDNVVRIGRTKNPDIDKIISLKPDIIFADKEENTKECVFSLDNYFPVFVSEIKDIQSVKQWIIALGNIFAKSDKSLNIVNDIDKTQKMLKNKLKTFSFAYLVWKNPYIVVGKRTYISSIIKEIGGCNVFSERNNHNYFEIELKEIIERKPDVIMLPNEPYNFTKRDADSLFEELSNKIERKNIINVDGYLVNGWGIQTPQALEYLLKMMQENYYEAK